MRCCPPLLCLTLLVGACAQPEAPASARLVGEVSAWAGEGGHLLLALELSAGSLQTLAVKRVEGPLPRRPVVDSLPWRVQLLGEDGRVRHTVSLPSATQVRGEFPDERGALIPVVYEAPSAGFTVRLPHDESAAKLRLLASRASVPVPPADGNEFVVLGELPLDRGFPFGSAR